jgi:hypothetical protein
MAIVDWVGDGGDYAGVMTRSIKPWDQVDNVPRQFVLSSVGVSETECVSSMTINVVLIHSQPFDVRITLTRVGKQSALPRATNMSTTIVLKDFDSTFGPSFSSLFSFFLFLFFFWFALLVQDGG